ncbi:hypothetical protein QRO08_03655 [Paracidovorax citrulli]|uniref:Uncharacterized protein n=2 Tax=Paracidovorax citrulli TaxID=80869 RepID=A1TUM6_PARC0|nr:hypothetical protein [Paracidovorax citrulli]ABM34664.1 hypothetical protein Aave_4123 [Paracidovorax citrulli AAC00-1]PVY64109.1 hypothetical protein C8E08_1420 [Paracidovorax citrulli]REG71689.1 hypothetical protein C8E07_4947 [Paracidovorax citrulli]RLJ96242.1 hypothetical protein C8E06_4942 [Paracidovorax citrulli]WIY30122.1 hypothetical protein QRO09_24425 [Paracidovorax citrulli]
MSLFKSLRERWLMHRYLRTRVLMQRERSLHHMHMAQLRAERDALALQIGKRSQEATR